MSVNQIGIIDIISTTPEGKVVLTISDHHSWDETWHFQLLQDKINAYLHFIESGQIFEEYPSAKGSEVMIETAMKYQPNSEAISFLDRARDIIKSEGYDFSWRVVNFDE